MKQGRTLAEVMQQVEKEAKAKRDLIVPAQSLFMGDEADCIGIHNKKAFLLKLRDATTTAIEESRFHTAVDQLKEAAGIPIEGAVTDVVELTAKNYGMNSDEQNGILKYLIEGGDLSKYGLSNAITRASQDIESYDRATVMEEVGWQVATMEPKQWKILNQ